MVNTQDFLHGVDYTGLANVTGADLNNGLDLGTPYQDSATEGKGLILVTKDTAIGIAAVPDATTHTKWRKYIWARIPFAGAASPAPIVYVWNNDAVLDATFQKWNQIQVDFTQLLNAINAVTGLAGVAKTEADQAIALAQAVNTVANNANTNATAALTAANSASAASTAATAVANTANANATTATANANAATASAAAVTTALNTYKAAQNFAIVVERAPAGTDLGGLVAGTTTRNLNTKEYDASNILTLAGGKISLTNAGTYVFDIDVPFVPNLTGANSQFVQAYLVKDSDGSLLGRGTSSSFQFTGIAGINCQPTLYSHIKAVVVATAGMVVRVDIKASATNGLLGKAVNLGTFEEYTMCRIQQIA